MARSYKKIVKLGNCGGSNTEYYRIMNRKCRAQNRHSLRNAIANYDADEIDDGTVMYILKEVTMKLKTLWKFLKMMII